MFDPATAAIVAGTAGSGAGSAYNAYVTSRAAERAQRTAEEEAKLQRILGEKYFQMDAEDRDRAWQRYKEYIQPMEQSMFGYASKLQGGDIAGPFARALGAVDPAFARSETAIRDRAARTGLERTNPGLMASLVAKNTMARTRARLDVRENAEQTGTNLMMQLLAGKGQPARTGPGAGVALTGRSSQLALQGAGYDMMGAQALGRGAQELGQGGQDLASMYWLDQYMPKKPGGGGGTAYSGMPAGRNMG